MPKIAQTVDYNEKEKKKEKKTDLSKKEYPQTTIFMVDAPLIYISSTFMLTAQSKFK